MLPQAISDFLATAVDYAWGMPLVVLLIGGGIYLSFLSHLIPLRGFGQAFKLLSGKVKHETADTEGQLSHFQALCNALAATVGMGNIGGVAIAIHQGGAGAVFWMWVAGMVGMTTKFFECSLAVMYRGKDYEGEVQGGPMYFIVEGLGKKWSWMAMFFAVCGLIGTLSMYQINELGNYVEAHYEIPSLLIGVGVAIFTVYILLGGVTRVAEVTTRVVPFMAIFYVGACGTILLMNFSAVPGVIVSIVREAFTGTVMAGGAVGVAFMEVMRIGVKRAAFSNEAGLGTAPLAHGNAKTTEPIAEGLVAMLGPFIDTIVICTMTALVILLSTGINGDSEVTGVLLTTKVFEENYPGYGAHFIGLTMVLFSVSTILGYSNYGLKCWNYVFRGRFFLKRKAYILFYGGSIVLASVVSLTDVINLLDTGLALMAFPTMIGTILLSFRVRGAMREYFKKYAL